jgi:hypothetical protein
LFRVSLEVLNPSFSGTFSPEIYPDYEMHTIPHVHWQVKPIRLPKAKEDTVMELLQKQLDARKYELSASSYQSTVFPMEKKGGSSVWSKIFSHLTR